MMPVLGSIHEADRGRRVRALATKVRAFGPDFPGWGDPAAASYLRPVPEGAPGTIHDVESHGSNPWTRYSVTFDSGLHAPGLILGRDIEFAGGAPPMTARRPR